MFKVFRYVNSFLGWEKSASLLYLLRVHEAHCMTIERYNKDQMYRVQAPKSGCDLYNLPKDWIRNDMLAVLLQDTVNACESCYQISYNLVGLLWFCVYFVYCV